jgi:hypothetical protein
MKRMLLAGAIVAALAACEPEYDDHAGTADVTDGEVTGAAPEHQLEVTGGADTAAISGRVPRDTGSTIHHPAADGNAGRPPDERTVRKGQQPGGGGAQ